MDFCSTPTSLAPPVTTAAAAAAADDDDDDEDDEDDDGMAVAGVEFVDGSVTRHDACSCSGQLLSTRRRPTAPAHNIVSSLLLLSVCLSFFFVVTVDAEAVMMVHSQH